MNNILQSLHARKSVRAFAPIPMTMEHKRAILEAAFQAPTAGNQMLYTIIDITDASLKAKLADLCDHQPFIASAPLVLVFLADCRRWLDTYREAGLTPRQPGLGDVLLAMADATIAAQNAVVAAESLGLGSCYIGDILEHCETLRTLLTLPGEVVPAAMLVIGTPTDQQKQRRKPARFDKRYVVFENAYQLLSPEEHRAMIAGRWARDNERSVDYDAYITAFCRRKYDSDFSREMSRSAKEYLRVFAMED